MKKNLPRKAALDRKLISLAVASCFAADLAIANPTAPTVVHGSAVFQQHGNLLQITNGPNAIINWGGFSIGASEITRFIQQSSGSAVLNRVIGQDPSSILGALQSNGRVFLINPNGILFGAGAQIDVAGLVASTLNLSNADFLAGRLNFTEVAGAGSIVNQGSITTGQGGNVYLVAPDITNSGVITSPKGEVILAAGKSVELVDPGTPNLRVEINAPDNAVRNLGQIAVDSGRVGIYAGLINHSGTIRADSAVVGENGQILLKATKNTTLEAGSLLSANGPSGGKIEIQSGDTTLVSGTVEAQGMSAPPSLGGVSAEPTDGVVEGKGGTVRILGNNVGLIDNARIDASGEIGGGTVLIGGDFQGKNPEIQNAYRSYFGPDARIAADAISTGDGGKVIIWSDDATRAYGTISARGGAQSGNGGLVEVSGKGWLNFSANVNTSAPNGATGTLLLDPSNVFIALDLANAVTAGMTGTDNSIDLSGLSLFETAGIILDSLLTTTSLTSALATNNVTVSTANLLGLGVGNITVVNPVSWSSTNSLTLLAHNNANVNAAIINAGSAGNVRVFAGWDGASTASPTVTAGTGSISLNSPITVSFTGAEVHLIAGNGITQTASGMITANNLLADGGSSPVQLDQATNAANKLAGSAKGDFRFKNGQALTIDTVGGVSGITVDNTSSSFGDATVSIDVTSGNLTVNKNVLAVGAGSTNVAAIALTAAGSMTIAGSTITATGGSAADIGGKANVTLTTTSGGITVNSSNISAAGGSATSAGTANVTLNAGTTIALNSSTVSAIGGAGTSSGGSGGAATVLFQAGGQINILSGSTVSAVGGNGNGANGGAASATITATNGGITVNSAGITATGGMAISGSSAAGGMASATLTATNGDITLSNAASVSATGGDGRSPGGDATVTLTANSGGLSVNSSTISAMGGNALSTGAVNGAATVTMEADNSIVLGDSGTPVTISATGGTGFGGCTFFPCPPTFGSAIVAAAANNGNIESSADITADGTNVFGSDSITLSAPNGFVRPAVAGTGMLKVQNSPFGLISISARDGIGIVTNPVRISGGSDQAVSLQNTGATGDLAVSFLTGDAFTSLITASNANASGTLSIKAETGGIQVDTSIGVPADLLLAANNDITQTATGTVTANRLLASSTGGSVLLDQATAGNTVNVLAGQAGGDFRFKNNQALQIGSVNGVSGIGATNNGNGLSIDVNVTAGNLSVNQPVTASGGSSDAGVNVNLTAGSGSIVVNSPISATGGPASFAGVPANVTLTATGGITVNGTSITATGGGGTGSGSGGAASAQLFAGGNIDLTGSTLTATAGLGAGGGPIGTGTILAEVSTFSGNSTPSGDIIVENIQADNVELQQNSLSSATGNSIKRASATSLIQADQILMEVDHAGQTSGGAIGTAAQPIRVQANALEAHTHEASAGIFVESPNVGNLQIGGASFYAGSIKGVQNVTSGDVSIRVNGTLITQSGDAVCGSGGTAGGPICTNGGNILLSAADMTFGDRAINAGPGIVKLAPFSTNTNINIGASGGLSLDSTELQRITAGILEIGRSTDTGTLTVATGLTSADVNAATLKLAHQNVVIDNSLAFGTDSENLTLTAGSGSVTVSGDINVGSGVIDASTSTVDLTGTRLITSANAGTGFSANVLNVGTSTATLDANTSAGTLNMSGGVLGGSGNVTVNTAMNWTGGTIAGAGPLLTNGSTTMNGVGPYGVNRVWDNAGTVTWTSGTINVGGAINNQSGATFNAQAVDSILGGGSFDNAGTFNHSVTGLTTIGPAFTNTGLLDLAAPGGTLQMNAFASNAGTINLGVGATLSTNGTSLTNTSTGVIQGLGMLDVASGTLTNDGLVRPAGTNVTGTLSIIGNLTQGASGILDVDLAGSLSGQFDVLALSGAANLGGTLNVNYLGGYIPTSGANHPLLTYASRTGTFATINDVQAQITNYGATLFSLRVPGMAWDGGAGDFLWTSPANWSVDILPTAVDDVVIGALGTPVTLSNGAQSIKSLSSDASMVVNGGSLTMANPSIINATLMVSGGTVNANGGLTTNGLNVSSGAVNGLGNLIVNNAFSHSGGTISGFSLLDITQSSGNLTFGAPLTVQALNAQTNAGSIVVDSPIATTGNIALIANGAVSDINISSTGGISASGAVTTTLTAGRDIVLDGTISATSGTLGLALNAGNMVHTPSGATLTLDGGAGGLTATVNSGKTWQNDGTITMQGASTIRLPNVGGYATFSNAAGGIINIDSTAVWSFTSDPAVQGGILNNAGTINVNDNTSWEAAFTNTSAGTLNIAAGKTLSMQNGQSIAGTADIGSGATLWVSERHGTNAAFNGTTINGSGTLQVVAGSGPVADLTGVTAGAATLLVGSGGAVNLLGGTSSFGALNMTGGTLAGSGDLLINNSFSQTGGTQSGTGTTTLGPSANSTLGAASVARSIVNQGVFDLSGPTLTGALTNSGTLNIGGSTTAGGGMTQQSGILNINSGQTFTIGGSGFDWQGGTLTGSGSLVLPAGSSMNITTIYDVAAPGPAVSASTMNILSGGMLKGTGTVNTNVNNSAGVVSPGASPGILTINGNYVQGPSGVLAVDVAGTAVGTQYDQLAVTGNVTLGGTLNATLLNGFVPVAGDTFNVIQAGGTVSGNFSASNFPTLSQVRLGTNILASTVDLVANFIVPPPSQLPSPPQISEIQKIEQTGEPELLKDIFGNLVVVTSEEPGGEKPIAPQLCR